MPVIGQTLNIAVERNWLPVKLIENVKAEGWIFLSEETVCPAWRKPPVRTTETAN